MCSDNLVLFRRWKLGGHEADFAPMFQRAFKARKVMSVLCLRLAPKDAAHLWVCATHIFHRLVIDSCVRLYLARLSFTSNHPHPLSPSISTAKPSPPRLLCMTPSRLDGTHVTPNTPDFRDTRQARDWASKAGMGTQGDAFVEVREPYGARLSVDYCSRSCFGVLEITGSRVCWLP